MSIEQRMGAVSDQDLIFFNSQGYLILEDLLTSEECDELNQHAADVVSGLVQLNRSSKVYYEPEAVEQGLVSEQNPDPKYLFKIGHQMHDTDHVFRYYAMVGRTLDTLSELIGPDIKCVQSMYIDKPKKLGVGQPYHQDSYYLKTAPDSLMAIWIACDDVDVDNGCLHVIPGSQHDPIHPHDVPVDPKQRKYFTEVLSARQRREVACPLRKGSAVVFPGTLLHRSGNNHTSDRQRRAYVLHYASAKSTWASDPTARNPHLLVRGRQYPGAL